MSTTSIARSARSTCRAFAWSRSLGGAVSPLRRGMRSVRLPFGRLLLRERECSGSNTHARRQGERVILTGGSAPSSLRAGVAQPPRPHLGYSSSEPLRYQEGGKQVQPTNPGKGQKFEKRQQHKRAASRLV